MSQEPRARQPFYSQIDVGPTGYPAPATNARGEQGEQTRLLRDILSAQDRQNELLEELIGHLNAQAKQKNVELGNWKQANPHLAKRCRMAAESLAKVQTEFLQSLTTEITSNYENLMDGEYVFNEFIDRYGPRMAHLNGILQVLAMLSASPNPAGPNM